MLVRRLSGDWAAKDLLALDKTLAFFHAVVVYVAQVFFLGSTALNALLVLRLRAEPLGTLVRLADLPAEAARVTGSDVFFARFGFFGVDDEHS